MDDYEERPTEYESIGSIEQETTTENDDKWYGVPPKGEQPLPVKWKYVLMIIGIIILEICIWAVYRYSTAELFQSFGTHQFYLFHIIAAPTIHLLPIILFWWLIRKERGLPFVFSKKLLLTGILIGFIAAIIWRLLEEFTYFGFATAAGGTTGDLFFINFLETADLFILMTFVMYIIVGPVEELEFRSFTQDQAARVMTNWQAVILSSILFGCSHIPIAIFVYELHLVPTQFVDALFGWIAAGFTFGVLYMYSRNIFACIVMHGMGNWQLSVFYFMGRPSQEGMSAGTAMMVGIMTSLVANIIMILIFYLIHKYYWEPHRRGEPAFGGRFFSLQTFLHEHDFEKRSITSTSIVFTIFIVIVSGIIVAAAAFGGSRPPWIFPPEAPETDRGSTDMDDFVEITGSEEGLGTLNVGDTYTISYASEPGNYIKEVKVTVTWTDEDDRYVVYENRPDTFSITVSGLNITQSASGANPQGGQGSIFAELSFSNENISTEIENENENYQVTIDITLEEAGGYFKRFGPIGITDPENDFEYTIDIIWLTPPE